MKKNAQTQVKPIKEKSFLLFSMILFTLTFFVLHNNLFGSQAGQYSIPASTPVISTISMQTTPGISTLKHFHCDPVTNDPQNTPGTSHLKCKIGVVNAPSSQPTPTPAPVAAPTPAPTPAAVTPNSIVLFDDNTSSQYQGWSVHRKETVAMGAPYNLNGMIIGRLDPKEEAWKGYILPTEMKQYFRLTFLFLKIGSPDNERAEVSINNTPIIGQNFWLYRDDPIIVGGQTVSVPFEPFANKPLIFNPQWNADPWPGQVMAVTMVFKKTGQNMVLLGRDGNPTPVSFPLNGNQLLLKLKSGLDEPIANESFGLMDIKGETFDTLDPAQIVPKLPTSASAPAVAAVAPPSTPLVLFDDNTTNGYPGWVVPRKENVSVGAPYNLNGSILGRLSLNETATKTFTLPGDMKKYFHLTISPLMKIDSVDGGDNDSISLKLNGINIFTQVMDWQRSTPVTINGEEASVRAEPFSRKNLVFTPGWSDEFLYVSLVFEKVGNDMVLLNKSGAQTNIRFPLTGNQFSIQLLSHLNHDITDESFGAANIKGVTLDTLDPSWLAPKFPPQ